MIMNINKQVFLIFRFSLNMNLLPDSLYTSNQENGIGFLKNGRAENSAAQGAIRRQVLRRGREAL